MMLEVNHQSCIATCCAKMEDLNFVYASVNSNPRHDTRYGGAGFEKGRCIFPMRP